MNNIKVFKSGNFHRLCIVINKNSEKSLITYLDRDRMSMPSSVSNELIYDLDVVDSLTKSVEHNYNSQIDELKSKLKSTKAIDYPNDSFIKERIKKVARNIAESDIEFEDERFEHNLSEILQLRKQLYGGKNEDAVDARKYNGKIKYEIRGLETQKAVELRHLNMDVLMEILNK